uniref:Uncharacterized protein n=2 Tax=Lotharella globosa TaxID=91324 RepID=A0A7S3YVY5_9EUKA
MHMASIPAAKILQSASRLQAFLFTPPQLVSKTTPPTSANSLASPPRGPRHGSPGRGGGVGVGSKKRSERRKESTGSGLGRAPRAASLLSRRQHKMIKGRPQHGRDVEGIPSAAFTFFFSTSAGTTTAKLSQLFRTPFTARTAVELPYSLPVYRSPTSQEMRIFSSGWEIKGRPITDDEEGRGLDQLRKIAVEKLSRFVQLGERYVMKYEATTMHARTTLDINRRKESVDGMEEKDAREKLTWLEGMVEKAANAAFGSAQ